MNRLACSLYKRLAGEQLDEKLNEQINEQLKRRGSPIKVTLFSLYTTRLFKI